MSEKTEKNRVNAVVAVVKLSGNSTAIWGISPPDRILLLQEVESSKRKFEVFMFGCAAQFQWIFLFIFPDQTVSVKFGWRVSRVSNNPEMVRVVVGEIQVFLPPFTNGYRTPNSISLKAGKSITGTIQEWWELSEICDDENYKNGDNRKFA
ncbi:hypothetical protein RUM44_003776 [Polyplax serrata]|uniref:Uncharacterized protein n=1 Tax=Polyplax serrata TaxID=468196 RepID=A0ABR1AHE1_POLSC